MDFKRLISGLLLASLVACTSMPKSVNSEKIQFQNYALSTCLGGVVSGDENKQDFNRAATGFMERSHISLEAFDAIRLLIADWLERDFSSKHGGQVNSAKCIALFGSQELDTLFNEYDPCKTPESWLNQNEFIKICG